MSFGVTELMIIAVIVLLLFGTTKLKSLGSDLGSAIKGFRSAMDDDKSTGEINEKNEINDAQLEADVPNPIPGTNQSAQSTEESSPQSNDSKKA
ncbi:MAG: sec-independent protein translocase protein TatA [Flavobacterium sp.]|jgi:sec-independent protein translocase protein TatA